MAKTNLDTAFANVAQLLDLAASMAIENPERISHEERDGYFLPYEQSEELTALLIVTRDYARRALKDHDEGRG